ncbi:inner centromere protein-like [Melanerpes formicivorus]|uniref:inner centromere protein-like n=1 Tax=Melanerpes formicivorus TaxID=211600 RepID=UPI0035901FBC
MAEADGPLQLLEVCERRLSRFLHDAEHKHLAWLREVEEQGLRMLDSNLGAEPELMSKTPSQRRRPRKRQSSCLKEEGREPGRRRSSRRRSSTKLALAKPSSQRRLSKLPAQSPGAQEPSPSCRGGPQAGLGAECPEPPGGEAPEGAPCEAGQQEPWGVAAPGLPQASPAAATSAAREEQSPDGASPPRAPGAAGAALLPGEQPPGPRAAPSRAPGRAEPGGCSGQRRSRRSSQAGKCPGGSRRSGSRRSLGRDSARRAAARETSPGRASCHSSLEVFVEDDVRGSSRPRLEAEPPAAEAPEDIPVSSRSAQAVQHPAAQHQQGGFAKLSSEPQQETQEPAPGAKPQEKPTHIWPRSCRQAVAAPRSGPQEQQQGSSAAQPPPSSPSPASKVVRPLKSLLQAVQRSQLLPSPGPRGQPGGISGFLRRKTPGRAALKGDFVERERQRLESLRRKQEAEEQRRKKVEEEKRRRQAEMKQKREERLRKALQAKERVEQMEEEKKRRMEQKMLQGDEKVPEERSRRKLSRKLEEAEARKQRALRREEHELEQQEALQRREDEVKGKRVWELRSLVEQRELEHMKERDHKQRWREKAPPGQLEPVGLPERSRKEEESPKVLQQRQKQAEPAAGAAEPWPRAAEQQEDALQEPQQLAEEKRSREAEALPAACATWLSKAVKRSVSASCLESLKGDANNYGMDLNSDDSTDDENDPRKPVPAWAEGSQLNQAVVHQYYHPVDVDQIFGLILSPRLEDIFGKSKPRYFKRTSSAVWTSPPGAQPPCGCRP